MPSLHFIVKTFFILLFATINTLLACCVVLATVYHVDFENGSDSNDGLSGDRAFKCCPGDNSASAKAALCELKAGDTVIFKGGAVYRGTIRLKSSGNDGHAIVYDGNSNGKWGQGRAIINNGNSPDLTYGFYTKESIRNVTIKNFVFTRIGGYAEWPPSGYSCANPAPPRRGIGIDAQAGGSNLLIEDCLFQEIGEWRNTSPASLETIAGSGISLQDQTGGVLIRRCEFTRLQTGVSVKASGKSKISGIEIADSDFHNHLAWAIDVGVRGANARVEKILIRNNKIHDYAEFDSVNWRGCGEKPHTDGIFLRANYDYGTFEDITVAGNEFYNVSNAGGGTAAIYLFAGPSASIYNNTFINTLHPRTIFLFGGARRGASEQTVRIYNNTFFNNKTAIGLASGPAHPLNPSFISIKNNIFYDVRDGDSYGFCINIEDLNAQDIDELDSNVYFTNIRSGSIMKWTGHANYTFHQLRSCSRSQNCKKWESKGIYADPQFMDVTQGLGAQCDRNDLRLTGGSPARASGEDLSGFFRSDKSGTPRTAPWSAGAYEFR